ncbi:hypothetical protein EDD86DRAFT_210039 [Gorgonomyces haynaldii]|nr:hypothetical protein EDD86DRAFT_210039 [Gorgonomyces haynaldii]
MTSRDYELIEQEQQFAQQYQFPFYMPQMRDMPYSPVIEKEKPTAGSQEWVKQRKETHKEVERRRRETINAGITELAKLVPGEEKNKGRILQRAVQYIHELHQRETTQQQKSEMEKLMYENTIKDCDNTLGNIKRENELLKQENQMLKEQLHMLRKQFQASKDKLY